MSDWISVDVAVPKTNVKFQESNAVLVSGDGCLNGAVCWYNSGSDTWHLDHFQAPSKPVAGVTHWMPLPEPPK